MMLSLAPSLGKKYQALLHVLGQVFTLRLTFPALVNFRAELFQACSASKR